MREGGSEPFLVADPKPPSSPGFPEDTESWARTYRAWTTPSPEPVGGGGERGPETPAGRDPGNPALG